MFPTLLGTVMWAAAQIRAFGRLVGAERDVPVVTMIIIGAVVVIAYMTIGDLMVDAITDFIQGVATIAGLIIMGFLVASRLGGIEAALESVPAERLSWGDAGGNPLAPAEM